MLEPIRVLHVIDSLAPGGAERMLVQVVNASADQAILPTVCVTRHTLTLAGQIQAGVPVFCLERRHTWDLAGLQRFGKQVRRAGYAVCHAHGYSSFRFALAACRLNGISIPIVLHAHSSASPDRLTRLVGRYGIDYFVATSAMPALWAQKCLRLSPKKVTLLENVIDPAPYQQAQPADLSAWFNPRPRWVAAVVANVLAVKDYETLFRALAASRYREEMGLLVIGSLADAGYVNHCRQILDELGLAKHVVFLGSRTDIPPLLKAADFALFASTRETGPLAMLEYMAAGLPFVSTQVGQIGEAAAQVGLGATVLPGDAAGFARALDALLDLPPQQWEHRRAKGRQLLAERFSLAVYMTRLRAIYDTLIRDEGSLPIQ